MSPVVSKTALLLAVAVAFFVCIDAVQIGELVSRRTATSPRGGGSSGSSGSGTKVSFLSKIDDKYQFTDSSRDGKCGASVRELFLLAQPAIISKIKASPAICNSIYPTLSDLASSPSKWGPNIYNKLLNSWDTVALKYDLYRGQLPSNPVVQPPCGVGTLKSPDNSNAFHRNTGSSICSETTTIGGTCHSVHAVNYYYGGLVYAACQEAMISLSGRGRILFTGYMYKKDSDGINWLKPQMQHWFDCGYSKNLGCFTNPRDVRVHSNWYDKTKTASLTKLCEPCGENKVQKTDFNLSMKKFLGCDLRAGKCT